MNLASLDTKLNKITFSYSRPLASCGVKINGVFNIDFAILLSFSCKTNTAYLIDFEVLVFNSLTNLDFASIQLTLPYELIVLCINT